MGERLQLQAYLPIAVRTLGSSACMDHGASRSFSPKLLEHPGLIAWAIACSGATVERDPFRPEIDM